MKLLLIGDVFGRAGRATVSAVLPRLLAERHFDLVIANAENLTNGRGTDKKRLRELFEAGVDVCTSGNHVWQVKEIFEFIDHEPRLVRPANFPEPCPGRGLSVVTTRFGGQVAVMNLLGRVYMKPVECPFRTADALLEGLDGIPVRVIDFHAEATSEKIALAWYLDGRVSVMAGTHTHVQTADERILPKGTATITDLGMTGPQDSVIGMEKTSVIENYLTGRPTLFEPAKENNWFHGAAVEVDEKTGRALHIERIAIRAEETAPETKARHRS